MMYCMKKFVFSLLLLLGVSAVMAQTDFRHIGYKEAIAAAKAEKKMVFIDFFTEWCGPCKRMSQNIFPLKEVGDYMNSRFVCIKIDAEKGEGPELADRFKVEAYPTMIVLDANEKVIGTKVGASSTGEDFIASIDRVVDPNKSPERLKERYDGGERSAELIAAYSGLLLEQAYENREPDVEKINYAAKIVLDYFHGLTDEQKLAAENVFIYTKYARMPQDDCSIFMVAHRNDFAPEIKEVINNQISTVYKTYLYYLFSGRIPYNQGEYEKVKKEVNEIGLNGDKSYDLIFRFIECYAAGDMNAYLDLCQKEFKNLDESAQMTLVFGMNALMKTADQSVLKRVSQFIRSQLANMNANDIYFAADVLSQIEGRITEK